MGRVDQHFQRFLREHIYLHNVAPKKSQWYRDVWQVFQRWWTTLPSDHRSRTVISRSDLQEFVVHLRERGVKPVSCNCYLRGLNAFCRWAPSRGPDSATRSPVTTEVREATSGDPQRRCASCAPWLSTSGARSRQPSPRWTTSGSGRSARAFRCSANAKHPASSESSEVAVGSSRAPTLPMNERELSKARTLILGRNPRKDRGVPRSPTSRLL